jgi:hypothetical protein
MLILEKKHQPIRTLYKKIVVSDWTILEYDYENSTPKLYDLKVRIHYHMDISISSHQINYICIERKALY